MPSDVRTPEELEQERIDKENQSGQVDQKAYLQVKKDMLDYKAKMKSQAEELAKIKADREAEENAKLKEGEKWAELFKKTELELNTVKQTLASERTKFSESHKINAVIQAGGAFVKPVYNKFIEVGNVQVLDDGSIDQESVKFEVERLKKEYPELIKAPTTTGLPNRAGTPGKTSSKDFKDMSPDELAAARRAASGNQ